MKMTTAEVGNKLGVTDGAVREMCQSGQLVARKADCKFHPEDGKWLIESDALEDYIRQQKEPKCKPLLETDKAYIAGILDGEGCFTAFISQVRRHPYIHWLTKYFIQILVVEEEPIHWLREVTGMGYCLQARQAETRLPRSLGLESREWSRL